MIRDIFLVGIFANQGIDYRFYVGGVYVIAKFYFLERLCPAGNIHQTGD